VTAAALLQLLLTQLALLLLPPLLLLRAVVVQQPHLLHAGTPAAQTAAGTAVINRGWLWLTLAGAIPAAMQQHGQHLEAASVAVMLMQTGQAAATAARMQMLLWLAATMSSAPSAATALGLSALQMQLLQPHQL
jgi:hypothetical protein